MPESVGRALRLRSVRAWVLSFALFAAVTALLLANRDSLSGRQAPVAMALLVVVLLGVVMSGRLLGLALAGFGFVVINYYFQQPYDSLGIHDPADWIVLISYIITADIGARLVTREREQRKAAQRRAAEVQRLAELGAESLASPISSVALQAAADTIARTVHLDRCELWDVSDRSAPTRVALSPAPAGGTAPPALDAEFAELHARLRAVAEQAPLATAEERAQRLELILRHAPHDALVALSVHDRVVGALRLVRAGGLALDDSEHTYLEALTHYAALSVERGRLVAELRAAETQRTQDRARDFLFATVSHDLRTPLTTIKALAHESARAVDRDVQTRNAHVIEEQADRLTRMVTDLLDLSRARAGALPINAELNTAEDVVGAALRQVSGVLRGREVQTHFHTDGGPLVGRFDFVATLRVLCNLLENAVKYAPSEDAIVLAVSRDGDVLQFWVADRGPGVPEPERERVFLPFHRADSGRAGSSPDVGSVGGVGLGLAVARALADAQQGTLTYAPRPGGGSVFTIRLPASDDAYADSLLAARV